ncbi:MAG: GAF domain-containing protein, partial [Pyrinomonadaceae bacterium]|nr:GAF domain-containing protein [Pyrinomonadaceae bacterium]
MSSSSVTVRLNDLPVEVRLERLEALVAASRALNLASGLDDILQTILTLVSQQLNCERATVFLRDERTSKLHARQMTGSAPVEIVLERGVGVAGHVAETGESVLLDDAHADPRFDAATDKRISFRTRAMLCVALRKPDGELLGAVQAINKRDGLFSQHDLAYLESFALLAAVAVHREQLVAASLRAELLSTELALARRIQSRLLPPDGLIETLSQPFSAWGRSQACY